MTPEWSTKGPPWQLQPDDLLAKTLAQHIVHAVQRAVQQDLRMVERGIGRRLELPFIDGEIPKLAEAIQQIVESYDGLRANEVKILREQVRQYANLYSNPIPLTEILGKP